jgi:hypothetical protein
VASKLTETKPDLPPARNWQTEPMGFYADEVDEDALLAKAAEILQRRSQAMPEPDPIPSQAVKPGEKILIHVLDAFSLDGFKRHHLRRGDEITVTHEQVSGPEWSNRRAGVNKFDDMLAEGRQIAPGPWPAWMPVHTFGSTNWEDARRAAVAQAAKHTDPDSRARAMAEVVQQFGEASFSPESAARYYQRLYSSAEAHMHARKSREARA